MKRLISKHKRNRVNHHRWYPFYAGGTLVVVLGVALCVIFISHNHTVAQLNYSRENLILSIRGNVNTLIRSFDKMTLPGVDVKGELLPSMRMNLYAIDEMNDVLIEGYGVKSAVLKEEIIQEIKTSLDKLESAIQMGRNISEAHGEMGICIRHVQAALAERFRDEDNLLPIIAST